MSDEKPKEPLSEIMKKSLKRALGGGISGIDILIYVLKKYRVNGYGH